jgi:hypothetical protein
LLNLHIGATQLALAIEHLPSTMLDDIYRRYAAFIDDNLSAAAAFQVTVRVRPGAPWLPWRIDAALPLRTQRCGACVTCMTPTEMGYFDLAHRSGSILLRPNGNIENCLRVLIGWEVAERGGLLLHASGVVRAERAFVFFGPSGTGKSTVARLSAQWPVLSDDLVLIESTPTGYQACGVPFRGNEWTAPRLNLCAPVAGLLALEQAPRHARLPLPPGAGAARLVACTPFVTTCLHGAALVMRAASAINAVTPVARLQFRKDEHFWEVLS